MKNSVRFLSTLLSFFFLFSCSNDDLDTGTSKEETSSLSFNIIVNNQLNRHLNKKQSENLPICSNEEAAYVELILSQDGSSVKGSNAKPLKISILKADLNNDGTEEYFTEESHDLELEPGNYILDYFKVFVENQNELWIAPYETNSSGFSSLVENPLPLEINLDAGEKKNIAVDVVCFDDRFVNQYGYSFFEIEKYETIPFCIFGNFCYENGRHAEATPFRVSVWNYSGNPDNPKGDNLYTDQENAILITDYEDYAETSAEPLCLDLPDREGLDNYYFEITLLDFNNESEESIIRTGVITDQDVKSLFDGNDNVNYYHFREGNCNENDSPQLFDETDEEPEIDPNLDTDGDGHPDISDNCPYQYNENQGDWVFDYYGEACFEPCSLFTDPEDHAIIATQDQDFVTIEHNNGLISLYPINTLNQIAFVDVVLRESKVIVKIDMYHATYLEDHLIELKDNSQAQIICKLIPPQLIEDGPEGIDSIVEIEVPEDFSAPFKIRLTANRFIVF